MIIKLQSEDPERLGKEEKYKEKGWVYLARENIIDSERRWTKDDRNRSGNEVGGDSAWRDSWNEEGANGEWCGKPSMVKTSWNQSG